MGRERRDTRRNQHKLVPTLEEGLEERAFTSTLTPASQFLQIRAAITAARAARAQGHVQGFTANSGRSRVITDVDRERYRADVLYLGVVRVQTAASAQAAIVVQGSGDSTELELKNVKPPRGAETSHSFPYNQTLYDGVLKVGLIDFASGRAKGVYGYGNIELTGPLNIKGTQDVQRIALLRLSPGATITTGGDLDTLDIYTDVTLSGAGTGIFVGRDLNAFNVNGNVTLTDGARIVVGRSVGLAPQPANGSGPGGQGFNIRGNLVIGPGSSLDIGRNIVGPIIVSGDLIGASRITVDGGPPTGGFIVGGQVVP